jgi:hypothetical protein
MKSKNKIKFVFVLLAIAVFLTGFFLGGFFLNKSPEASGLVVLDNQEKFEVLSPKDRILKDNINVYSNKIVIDVKDAMWAEFKNTGSMEPVLYEGANSFEVKPDSYNDIIIGDVISYNVNYSDSLIVHRVVKTEFDENGWYAIVKGDNLDSPDVDKVRFEQIHGVLIGVFY